MQPSTTDHRVFVGLGANLGDPLAALQAAVVALGSLPQTALVAVSPFYRSAPVDANGPHFVNAVVELKSSLPALQLLRELQAIEAAHGRQRPYRHAPRTLDLDLLLVGQQVIDSALSQPALQLPHPRLHLRAFVLRPLLDLWPDAQHPLIGPLHQQLPAVADQVLQRLASSTGPALPGGAQFNPSSSSGTSATLPDPAPPNAGAEL